MFKDNPHHIQLEAEADGEAKPALALGQIEFDCMAKATREGQPEPFVLIASDPLAPWLIDVWASMSRGDVPGALGAFYGMVDTNTNRYTENPRADDKVSNAENIAMLQRNWRIGKGLK